MTKFDYKRRLEVGNQVAESDNLLHDNFVSIGANEYVGKPTPAVIVGRKGSGKTALRLHFQRNHCTTQRVFVIEPSHNDLIGIFEYSILEEHKTFFHEFVGQMWELTVLINLARVATIGQPLPLSAPPSEFSGLPSKLFDDIRNDERYGIGRTLDLVRIHFPNDEKRATLARALKRCAERLIIGRSVEYFVLIDSIDDVLHSTLDATKRNDLFATFFEALWSFCRAFANRSRNTLANNVFLHIFVPFDLYNWSIDRHADHLRQYKHQVSWQRSQLEEFITARLIHNLSGKVRQSINRQPETTRQQSIWLAFFRIQFPMKHRRLMVH